MTMSTKPKKSLRERVRYAADRLLKHEKAVGLLDVFLFMRLLEPTHFEGWKKGNEYYPILEKHIQCGEKKFDQTVAHFQAWTREQQLESFEVTYELRGRHDNQPLQLTTDGNEARETLFRTKYRPANLTDAQKKRVEKKVTKAPDLLVYIATGNQSSECSECQAELEDMLYLEKGNALCLDCADMAHLEFLPSGNATLTRRAKKLSPLAAVVVKFNRRRKRYERQGILVTAKAIAQAEAACEEDADKRATQREKAAVRRVAADVKLVSEMTGRIMEQFRSCPEEEAKQIATHTAERGSGRVGRSAAGQDLEPDAIRLAVRAWIRHQHTEYDSLLMKGVERYDAREIIAADLEKKVSDWQS